MKVSYDLYETLLANVYLQFSQTSFEEISALWHKRNCGHKIIDFQKSSNICVSCFLRRIRLAKKRGVNSSKCVWKQLYFSSEYCPKPNKKIFRRVGATKFCRASAPETKEGKANNSWGRYFHVFFHPKLFSKGESFVATVRNTFTECLPLIPSGKFWQNFFAFSQNELWTQNNRFQWVVQNSLSTD